MVPQFKYNNRMNERNGSVDKVVGSHFQGFPFRGVGGLEMKAWREVG